MSKTAFATAFAPAHITGVFAPRLEAPDPRARGSVGAGLVLDVGTIATAAWTSGAADRVSVRAAPSGPVPISTEVAERLKGTRRGRLAVELTQQLPVGQGFGMSAAGALATARAVATVLELPASRAAETAHLADLFGGGGLGGVASILGGGLELRTAPGIPPWGSVRRAGFPVPVFIVVLGRPLPSPGLLGNAVFLGRVRAAATPELQRPRRLATPEGFLAAAERFTDRLALAPPVLARRIRSLRGPGIRVAQTMFGRALFAVPLTVAARRRLVVALESARLPAVEVRAAPPSTETL